MILYNLKLRLTVQGQRQPQVFVDMLDIGTIRFLEKTNFNPSHVFLTRTSNNNKRAQRTLFDGGPLRKCTHPTQMTSDLCAGNFLAFVYSDDVHCVKLLCHLKIQKSKLVILYHLLVLSASHRDIHEHLCNQRFEICKLKTENKGTV